MRQFLILGHDAPTDAAFSLDDLPGGAGRLDVLCRCVTTGLLNSHGIRTDAAVTTLHQNEIAVRFDGESIKRLNPDERSTAARFRTALGDAENAIGSVGVESSPGVIVAKRNLTDLLAEVPKPIIQLHPGGDSVTTLPSDTSGTFVLSDHRRFADHDEQILEGRCDRRISVGPVALHADQAITVLHNYLDTDGYHTY